MLSRPSPGRLRDRLQHGLDSLAVEIFIAFLRMQASHREDGVGELPEVAAVAAARAPLNGPIVVNFDPG